MSPRAPLMIAGSEAETRYFSEAGVATAGNPRELFLVEGATHADLYDKDEFVKPAVAQTEGILFRISWLIRGGALSCLLRFISETATSPEAFGFPRFVCTPLNPYWLGEDRRKDLCRPWNRISLNVRVLVYAR